MAVPNYGVLVGTITDKLDSDEARAKFKGKPHFQLQVDAGGTNYRVAINVKSDQAPANVMAWKSDNFQHPVTDKIKGLAPGMHLLNGPNSGALDYIRGNLFPMADMEILPPTDDSSDNDMNDIVETYVKQSMETEGSLVYAFGSAWPDDGKPDQYFGFEPAVGIHDIHMNQGNDDHHAKDNGVYTDGGLIIYYPDQDKWFAIFIKFQSQTVHTDDNTAVRITAPSGAPVKPEVETPIAIFAALVNPKGVDTGKEKVYLVNTKEGAAIDLAGWTILDSNGGKEPLHGTIQGGDVLVCKLTGKGAQMSNKGGTITLLNKQGLKVSGVAYTAAQAAAEGVVILF